jgi:hypothetical protein
MKNIISTADTITLRRERDDKPAGVEYLYADGHNPGKHHHIIISTGGLVYYNQAINYAEIVRGGKLIQPGGFQDFYEWTRVYPGEFHGYRKYIDQARLDAANERATRLEPGDTFRYWNNQAFRDASCLAVLAGDALIVFEMPSGGEFLHVIKARRVKRENGSHYPDEYTFVRNISWRKIPQTWQEAAGI